MSTPIRCLRHLDRRVQSKRCTGNLNGQAEILGERRAQPPRTEDVIKINNVGTYSTQCTYPSTWPVKMASHSKNGHHLVLEKISTY